MFFEPWELLDGHWHPECALPQGQQLAFMYVVEFECLELCNGEEVIYQYEMTVMCVY